MRNRCSARKLLFCLALSQVLALQALVLAWSGAQAVAGERAGTFDILCIGGSANPDAGTTVPPAKSVGHQDCLSACAAGQAVATAPERVFLILGPAVYARIFIPGATPLLDRSGTQVFLARGPPTLT